MKVGHLALLSLGVVGAVGGIYGLAAHAEAPAPPTMVLVTPENVTGQGVPKDWGLVRNGRGLSYWVAPEVWRTLERK